MKKQILIQWLIAIAFMQSVHGQDSNSSEIPFKRWSIEASSGGTVAGSAGALMRKMNKSGLGNDVRVDGWWIFEAYTQEYPEKYQDENIGYTLRYQYNHGHGFALMYQDLENYSVAGHGFNADITLFNKVKAVSVMYMLVTPNQRLKSGAGISYLWGRIGNTFSQSPHYQSHSTAFSTPGLKVNSSFTFVRIKPFFLSFYADLTLAGSVRTGEYQLNENKTWSPGRLNLTTFQYGISGGISF